MAGIFRESGGDVGAIRATGATQGSFKAGLRACPKGVCRIEAPGAGCVRES